MGQHIETERISKDTRAAAQGHGVGAALAGRNGRRCVDGGRRDGNARRTDGLQQNIAHTECGIIGIAHRESVLHHFVFTVDAVAEQIEAIGFERAIKLQSIGTNDVEFVVVPIEDDLLRGIGHVFETEFEKIVERALRHVAAGSSSE